MHLFLEQLTLAFFLACAAHAAAVRGRAGAGLFAAMLWLGFARESFVLRREILYGFASLHLMLDRAPLIATIVWGYSIYVAVVWAEGVTGEDLERRRHSGRFLGLVVRAARPARGRSPAELDRPRPRPRGRAARIVLGW